MGSFAHQLAGVLDSEGYGSSNTPVDLFADHFVGNDKAEVYEGPRGPIYSFAHH